jgi:hypothetical protein
MFLTDNSDVIASEPNPIRSSTNRASQASAAALFLEELWAESLALREHALHVRAVSMEVRAIARDMRLRREVD